MFCREDMKRPAIRRGVSRFAAAQYTAFGSTFAGPLDAALPPA